MKLLYITESTPNRDPVVGDGSSMIPFEVLRHLPPDVEVTLLTFAGELEVPPEVRRRCIAVHILPKRGHFLSLARSVVLPGDVGSQERSTRPATKLVQSLSGFSDATLLHGPHILFLAAHLQSPGVLQTVDPWSIRTGMDGSLRRGWRASYRSWKSRRILAEERRVPDEVRLLTVGARDAASWSKLLNRAVRSIPNGVEPVILRHGTKTAPVVCFVGSLNYAPNVDSARVLINEVAPLVWQQMPTARFVIAGRQPVPEVLRLAGPRVDVLPNVPLIGDVFEMARVAAFADEHGIGIRNSVGEALAAGLPVVATSIAAREQDQHPLLMIEDDKKAFAQRIVGTLISATPAPQSCEGTLTTGPARTWTLVAEEYLAELKAAARTGSGDLAAESPSL